MKNYTILRLSFCNVDQLYFIRLNGMELMSNQSIINCRLFYETLRYYMDLNYYNEVQP